MIAEFKTDCVKRNAKMLFRIHWDGDFFNKPKNSLALPTS